MAVLSRTMKSSVVAASGAALTIAVACGPMPSTEDPSSSHSSQTTVTVTRGSVEASASGMTAWPAPEPASKEVVAATPFDPPPSPVLGNASSILSGSTAEGPLAMPTTIAVNKSTMFVFGRTRTAYVVRILSLKWDKSASYGPPIEVASAHEGDAEPAAAADADGAWFGVSAKDGREGAQRIARVDLAGKITTAIAPAKIGRIAVFVPLGTQAAIVGQSGTAITYSRVKHDGANVDATAKTIGQASLPAAGSRSPRAVREDEKVLVAWDGVDLAGALESPGTTDAERAAPKPGIYVQRFSTSGESASPLRRLTRPGFEAHTLDVAVELGACAVLTSTSEGFEMFRFVRKGNDLGPYGGGLFLASASATKDVALTTDAYGTLAVTSTQLLRIGPGVKIVPSPLGFQPPPGSSFDVIRVQNDGLSAGSVAHVVLSTRVANGLVPTLARVDGEKMGSTLATPWIGPPPQEIAFGTFDGDEALAMVIDAGTLTSVRIGANGAVKGTTSLASVKADDLAWDRPSVPRAAHTGDAWLVGLKDGRVLVASGASAGKMVPVGKPSPGAVGGAIALVSNAGNSGLVRAFWIPPAEKLEAVWSATIDPAKGEVVDPWWEVAGTEKHFGALGGTHVAALARRDGGLYLISNSGPKVPIAAQLFDLITLGSDGTLVSSGVGADAPVQNLVLAESLGGAALVATFTGEGTAVRWPDAGGGWKKSFAFHPFEVHGEGPIFRDKELLALPTGHLPFVVQGEWASLLGERCPIVGATGPRALLLVCHEGSGLAPHVVARTVTF